jgi:hypothetical protein
MKVIVPVYYLSGSVRNVCGLHHLDRVAVNVATGSAGPFVEHTHIGE